MIDKKRDVELEEKEKAKARNAFVIHWSLILVLLPRLLFAIDRAKGKRTEPLHRAGRELDLGIVR